LHVAGGDRLPQLAGAVSFEIQPQLYALSPQAIEYPPAIRFSPACLHAGLMRRRVREGSGLDIQRSMTMSNKNHLPPELDPSEPDAALEPSHEVGEQPGKRSGEERNDPEVEPGAREGKP